MMTGGLAAFLESSLTPHHIGIVVSDLESAMDGYQAVLGAAFSVFEADETNSTFSGSSGTYRLRFGIGMAGATTIELIQPAAGVTYYSSYLAQHGPGLHHLAFGVKDIAAARAQLDAQGYTCLMNGSIHGLCSVSYYQAPRLACIIEPIQFSIDLPAFLLKNAKVYQGT